jgi:transposase
MVTKLLAAGVARVGIERPDGPVVDAMRAAGLVVYVISPNQIKNLRSRYGSAGNKDDQFDAYVLADIVRTDHRRLRPLIVDTAPTTALRHTVPARRDLVAHRIAVANQLRAHLQICFPGAVGLFAEIDSTSACGSWNASPPKIAPTGSRPRDGLLAVLGGLLRAHPARHPAHPPAPGPGRHHRPHR